MRIFKIWQEHDLRLMLANDSGDFVPSLDRMNQHLLQAVLLDLPILCIKLLGMRLVERGNLYICLLRSHLSGLS